MLNLDQVISANRPCIFITAESDVELLRYIDTGYSETTSFFVYSSTFCRLVSLSELIKSLFSVPSAAAQSTDEVLVEIINQDFSSVNVTYNKYIFLDCQNYISDPQNIRRIKDILSKYQFDNNYTVSLIFVSQSVCVPPELERLSEVVFFDLPNINDLREHSNKMTKGFVLEGDLAPTEEVVLNLKGLTLFEVEQAYFQSYYLYKKIDLSFIRNFKKNAIAKTNLLSLMETNITFDDIGGLSNLKNWIQKSYGGWTVEGLKFGLPLLKGLLLVGIPGTGKSLTAKALGNTWGLPVIKFDMSRLLSSRIGDSENNMLRVLKILENVSPVVVFIDEIEKSMAGLESSTFSDAGTTARIISTFLAWMQDNTKPIFIVATANAIQYVAPELISRFDKVFFVNLPQKEERKEIFKIHLKAVKRDPDLFDLDSLAEKSKDLSGREIEQVVKDALYSAFYKKREITMDDIINVLNSKPGIMLIMKEKITALLKWVGWDNQRRNGVRAEYASLPDNVESIQSEIDKLISEIENNK